MFSWLTDHLWLSAQLAVAGAWTSVWEKGVGYGTIAVLLGLAFGSQLLGGIPLVGTFLVNFFKPLREDLLKAAFCVALVLAGEYVGANAEAKKCVAKTVVIEKTVDRAVDKTKTPAAIKSTDPYDSKDN